MPHENCFENNTPDNCSAAVGWLWRRRIPDATAESDSGHSVRHTVPWAVYSNHRTVSNRDSGRVHGQSREGCRRLTTFRVLICKMAIGTAAAERLLIQWNSESNPSNKPLATRCYLSSPGQIWSLPCMQTAYSLGRALYTGLRIRIKHLRRHPSQNLPPRLYHLIEPHVPGDSSVPPDHEDTCGRPWSNPWRTMSKRHV